MIARNDVKIKMLYPTNLKIRQTLCWVDTLKAMKENGESFDEILRPVEKLFSMLTAVSVTPAQAQRYLNGGALTISRCRAPKIAMPEGTQVALYEDGEKFLGLARAENGEFKYVKSFSEK